MKRRIVLLGPPASGKGTIADRLNAEYALAIASPGAMLREEQAAGTELGLEAAKLTKDGNLVPDEMVNAVVAAWLAQQETRNFIFDGYPRTLGQAEALEAVLQQNGTPLEAVLLLEADADELRRRVEQRAQCRNCRHIVSIGLHVGSVADECPRCGGELIRRVDDTAITLEHRFKEYEAKTAPLVAFYERRGLLSRVNTERLPDRVFLDVKKILL